MIHFIDQFNFNKTGFLTKYDGIISDFSTIDDCSGTSSFSLPASMAQLVRNKQHISRKEFSGPFKSFNNDKITFTEAYKHFATSVYVLFIRDMIILLSAFLCFGLNFDKKKCLLIISFILSRFGKMKFGIENQDNIQDEESIYSSQHDDYATTQTLKKAREELVSYIDVCVMEVNETINKKAFISSVPIYSSEQSNYATTENLKKTRDELISSIEALSSKLSSTELANKENLKKTRDELISSIEVLSSKLSSTDLATTENLKKTRDEFISSIEVLSSKLSSTDLATTENLKKTREELISYINTCVSEVNEIIKKKSFTPSNAESLKLLSDLNNDIIKYSDMQKILKARNIKASGTATELRERLYQVVKDSY